MNYILGILIASIVVLFLYSKHLYDKNSILIENEKVIIEAYENSIDEIEKKAKFDLDIEKSKIPVVKASEKVKIEAIKRGEIEKVINNNNNDFFIVSF